MSTSVSPTASTGVLVEYNTLFFEYKAVFAEYNVSANNTQ